jgi:ribosomal protein S18 acetylase RimI-like enzyme
MVPVKRTKRSNPTGSPASGLADALKRGADASADVRALVLEDLPEVRRIDTMSTGEDRAAFWDRIAEVFFGGAGDHRVRIALGVEHANGLAGFLLGEVRAFEFGSEACGWVFAVGVDAARARLGVASVLLDEACSRFAAEGVHIVRTMVRRTDVPVLSFFRSNGFVGGSFVQLELDLAEHANQDIPPKDRA